ncbi:MAG TPA: S9 family peptidase [Streptosporangiaceae bacterium]|nr:S9 family peptidase [Streptosporangiaceae bacterium]
MTFHDFDRISTFSLHPGGERVLYTCDAGGESGLWEVPVDGGPPARAYPAAQRPELCLWRPDGRAILVNTDPGGAENYQLTEVDAATGSVSPLSRPGVRYEVGIPYHAGSAPYSPDSARLAYSSNARDPAVFDVRVRDLDSGAERTVLAGDDRYFPMRWSPDSELLLILRLHQNTEQDLFACHVGTGEVRHLTPHEGPAIYWPVAWSHDGRGCYVLTSQGREFTGLALLEVTGSEPGRLEWIAAPGCDIDAAVVSADGGRLAWACNADGWSELQVRDAGGERVLTGLPRGVYAERQGFGGAMLELAPDGRTLICLRSTATAPTELFAIDLDTGSGRPLTRCGARTSPGVAEPEVVRIPSGGGVTIPAFLYRPPGADGGARVPVVLSVHGGPEGQERPDWGWTNSLYQPLLAAGVGVLAPNIRGSSGYGISYQRLIYRDWGFGDVRDFAACVDYLRGLDWADPRRLGVFGGSYGGFAALSCLARMPEAWRVGVELFGPADLIHDARTVPPHWRHRVRGWLGDPDDDATALRAGSPLGYADRITAPLLVIHGANDARVSPAASDAVVARLRELGREVEYMVIEGEGHGFADRETFARVQRRAIDWLLTHLKGIPEAKTAS